MATDITISKPPGYYSPSVTVDVTWPPDARKAIVTRGSIPPVLTEILAYDKGPIGPPGSTNATSSTARVNRPFMAVTQDGNGNIVYDGGFPKYYNMYQPNEMPQPMVNVFRFQGWCNPANNNGEWGVGNDAYYETFSNVKVKIAKGDVLVYSMNLYGRVAESAVDARLDGNSLDAMRAWAISHNLSDTKGVNAHGGTNYTGIADGRWYTRTIPLDLFIGRTMDQWRVCFEGNEPGWYTSYFRDIYVKNAAGQIKATLFNGSLQVPSVVGAGGDGNSNSYEQITKTVVNLSVFDQLPGAWKYLHNVMKFIANPQKVASGNNKLLIIGNVHGNKPYCIRNRQSDTSLSTDARITGFRDTFDAVAGVAGKQLTYYDTSDTGDKPIDLKFAYLNQFAGVIFLSSKESNGSEAMRRVTPAFAKELNLYRLQGNGVFVVTDHSNEGYTSPADAAARTYGFPQDANRLTEYWSAYFTNSVDRHPIDVAAIRQQLRDAGGDGNHPLLNNLLPGDAIHAGESESLVIVDTYPNNQVPVNKSASFLINTPGDNWLNILVQRQDGTVFVRPLKYTIVDPEAYQYIRADRSPIVGDWATNKLGWDSLMQLTNGATDTLVGSIYKNDIIQGYWHMENNQITIDTFAGPGKTFRIDSNSLIHFRVEQPYIYNTVPKRITTARLPLSQKFDTVAHGLSAIHDSVDFNKNPTQEAALLEAEAYIKQYSLDYGEALPDRLHWPKWFARYYRSLMGPLGSCLLWVAPTLADWNATKPVNPQSGQAAIIAATNAVYYWNVITRAWVLHPQKANELFEQGRRVQNQRDNKMWTIGVSLTTLD